MKKGTSTHALFHTIIAYIGLTVVAAVLTWIPHSGWGSALILIFMAVSQVTFFLQVFANRRFNGYGIAKQVNAMTGSETVPSYMPAWRGFALLPLVRAWKLTVIAPLALVVISTGIMATQEETPTGLFVQQAIFTYAAARILALAAEIYVWVMADHHRHWYIAEARLRALLAREKRAPKAIDAIVARARGDGLLQPQ